MGRLFIGYNDRVDGRLGIVVGALLAGTLGAQTARVGILVTDQNGAAIVTSEASLINADDKPIRTAPANAAGEIVLTGVPLGFSRSRSRRPISNTSSWR